MSLNPHDRGMRPHASTSGTPEVYFTFAELARLRALRERFQAHPDHGDTDAALRRLEFARWLVQHGRLSDGCVPSDHEQRGTGAASEAGDRQATPRPDRVL